MSDNVAYTAQQAGVPVTVITQIGQKAVYTTHESGTVEAQIQRPQQVMVMQYMTGPMGPAGPAGATPDFSDMPDLTLIFENKLI